jgi:tricorn protease-like protein
MRASAPADRDEEAASILVLDVDTGELSSFAAGRSSLIHRFGVDASGRYVAWGAPDDSLQVWD